jgi:GNAT superfamily N-acetyltransferase
VRPRKTGLADFSLMRRIHDHDELIALCDDDVLCRWAAQGMDGHSRAWAHEQAVAVARPDISRRDRLAVRGPAEAVIALVRAVLPEVGRTYRLIGDAALLDVVAGTLPGLEFTRTLAWMDTTAPPPLDGRRARWLEASAQEEIAALVGRAFPDSDAQPGMPGVEGWAGVRDDTGRLAAVAALAWSAPDVGLLTGVAVHPDARGQGLGGEVCSFAIAEAVARHGTAALMVEEDNTPAVRLYRGLGMSHRLVRVAAQRPPA